MRSMLVALSLIGPAAAGPSPALDTLVAGGDTVLARWEHDLVARNGFAWPLAGVARILQDADAALANLECCVALAGAPADKGEHCPFFYRARPEMLRSLTGAGIDIVTIANNHGGDYGPSSVAETCRWTRQMGLVCVGGGRTAEEAEAPRFVLAGRTRLAIAGMDTTMPRFRARDDLPGTNHASERGDLAEFTAEVKRLAGAVRGRCDLLVLTIHWGDNWVRETQPAHRRMARIAFENGVDLILGHSAHRLQGIEIIDGKVVVYDMGNLLFDCALTPDGQRSALFRLGISPAGVHRVEVIPVRALEGHTVLAEGEAARETLDEMRSLCAALGTALEVPGAEAPRPIGAIDVPRIRVTPRPPVRDDIEFVRFPATREIDVPRATAPIAARIPAEAIHLDRPAALAPGVELLAYRLPERATEGGILSIATWWRVTRAVDAPWLIALRLSIDGQVARRGTIWYTRHDPGDWTLPLSRMRPGEIVEDLYPARLAGLPAGPCEISACVIDPARPEADRALDAARILGSVPIEPRPAK
ncbi:MAG: CapA family protein [Planctomycetes bacterium]|nr:CapA family protein [Planctomycetota bacterium]